MTAEVVSISDLRLRRFRRTRDVEFANRIRREHAERLARHAYRDDDPEPPRAA